MSQASLRKKQSRRHLPSVGVTPAPGAAPGELKSDPQQLPTQISVLAYGQDGYQDIPWRDVPDLESFTERWQHIWIRVVGLKSLDLIEQLGNQFHLHRLTLEDILNTEHRPKVEDYEQYLFVIVRMGRLAEQFETDQFSLILCNKVVISFEEKPSRTFDLVRDRIHKGTGRIRAYGVDYLMYSLLDAIVDSYYPVLETLNRQLESLESEIIEVGGEQTIKRIHHIKSDLLYLHRAIYPMRDIINTLAHEDRDFVQANIVHYLRDCHDQCVQVTDLTEFYRDVASGLMNTYLAYAGHRMNEIVKVLTMVSTIFIPLSFIASVYGMNFSTASPFNMPELGWKYGYPTVLLFMLIAALGMLVYFKRRGWDKIG
jgi:magnesium transporter